MNLRYLVNKVVSSFRDFRGFTLAELLVALAIGSTVAAASTQILTQAFIVVPKTEASILAMRHVQTAGHWIDRDATQAQVITPADNLTYDLSTTPLVFTYVNWISDTTKTITYSVDTVTDPANYKLNRRIVVRDQTGQVMSDNQMNVADSIISVQSQYVEPEGQDKKVLALTITARVENSSKTKVFMISPRSF
jgi:prepilin-type N-terminal cleavage/methylation domain-containing protein